MNRELLIMRHAKSAWNTNAPSDFHRGLSTRGRNAATLMGHWLLDHDAVPDRVIASSAVRVVETLEIVVKIADIKASSVTLNRNLYATNVDNWINYLRAVPNSVNRILICGHNPELEALSSALSRTEIPPGANGKVMPTATVVRLAETETTENSGWSDLTLGTLDLVSVTRPREIQV